MAGGLHALVIQPAGLLEELEASGLLDELVFGNPWSPVEDAC